MASLSPVGAGTLGLRDMRSSSGLAAAAALTVVLGSSAAHAATLVHPYDFSETGGATGTLTGNASIAGGVLSLDGDGDAATFATLLIPFAGDFSVLVRAQLQQPVSAWRCRNPQTS